ncbi:hypothetical protein IMSAGC019_01976 [Lachnospiraceae bacterium]|nr:hypothetical protein IMSAGC019_01976 [Lachnospiraceae bacterium]
MLIGKETAKSDYVNWEIKTAADMGKRIVGVFCKGLRMRTFLQSYMSMDII